MRNLLLGSTICLSIVGCATPSYNYKPTTQEISKPPIGEVSKAYLGDHMLTQGVFTKQDAIYVNSTHRLSMGYDITSGYFAKQGEDDKYEQYKITNDLEAGKVVQKLLADPVNIILVRKADDAICLMAVLNQVVACSTEVSFERKNWETANKNNFQQTLIYNGKVGQKINIGYREFSSDLARPAFNNDVEYDLSESKQIGYKGALIDVLEANNQEIKYKVIKSFK